MHRQLDMAALDLRAFDPGALVWRNGKGSVVGDPFRRPTTALSTVAAPIGSPFDKARIALLRHRLRSVHPARLLRGDDISTRAALADAGFSETIIERFFRPLVGGIQLDPDLTDSRRMFDVIFRMLADGDSAVPAAGMQAIPRQLADRLPVGTVHLDAPVTATTPTSVTVGGSTIAAAAVVVATEGPVAASLLGLAPVESKSVGAVYFAAPEAPIDDQARRPRRHRQGTRAQRRRDEQRGADLRPSGFAPRRGRAPRPRRRHDRGRCTLAAARVVGIAGRHVGPPRDVPHRPRPTPPAPTVRPEATGRDSTTADSCAATIVTPPRSRERCTPAGGVRWPSPPRSARLADMSEGTSGDNAPTPTDDDKVVRGIRFVPAEPQAIFDLLADPSQHPLIDGSGSVRSATEATRAAGRSVRSSRCR